MDKGRDGCQAPTAGVFVERNDRHCVVYRGTRAALIAAGLARGSHFPEDRRRFSWHFPKSGINWGVRRKHGDVYCLTKLKDPRGVVEAELAVFYRYARNEARSDAKFQNFLAQVQTGRKAAPVSSIEFMPLSGESGHGRRVTHAPGTSGLETLAVATLLFGLTVYLWTRQA